MRLIDADALKYRREEYGAHDDVPMEERKKGILYLLKEDIDDAPTIEPIRCGECIHHDAEIFLCYYHNMPTTEGWFCADGERLVK